MTKEGREKDVVAVLLAVPHQSRKTPWYFRKRLLVSPEKFRGYDDLTYDKDADRIITRKGCIVFKTWLSSISLLAPV